MILTDSGALPRAPQVHVRGVEHASLCVRGRRAERLGFERDDADKD